MSNVLYIETTEQFNLFICIITSANSRQSGYLVNKGTD